MPKKLHVKKKTGVTSQTQEEILKIATSFLLAMTAVFVLAPFVCALAVRIVVIARNEAIFLCFFCRQSCKTLRATGYTRKKLDLFFAMQSFNFLFFVIDFSGAHHNAIINNSL